MIILDTNVISEPIKTKPDPLVIRWLDRQAPATLYFTSISIAELSAGIRLMPAGKRRTALEMKLAEELSLLFDRRVLSFGEQAGRLFGEVVALANAAGNPIDFADAALASIALQHGYMLATRNERDFKGTGVRLVNPWKERE